MFQDGLSGRVALGQVRFDFEEYGPPGPALAVDLLHQFVYVLAVCPIQGRPFGNVGYGKQRGYLFEQYLGCGLGMIPVKQCQSHRAPSEVSLESPPTPRLKQV